MTARIDPELAQALHSAAASGRPVEAYVVIQAPPRDSGQEAARQLLGRVEKQTGCQAVRSQYLVLIESIHLSAPPEFLRVLLEQPEVVAAQPPPATPGPALIPPVDARRASPEEIDTPVSGPGRRT